MSLKKEPYDDLVEPRAASMAESLRAFGYDLGTALADLADNSIFHSARQLKIHFHWAGEHSAIALSDDGDGMDEPTLINAMRVGSQNPRDTRHPDDFGRFGLGLKTASFSQCRRVTVFTRRKRGETIVRCWDLDHISKTQEWRLLREPSPLAEKLAAEIVFAKAGTFVVWENLDRLTAGTKTENDSDEDTFLRRAEAVGRHFSLVFHRIMTERKSVAFSLNGKPIKPWDPFLAGEPATQQLPTDRLRFKGHVLEIRPFVLPHLSKLDAEKHKLAAGLRGWNAHQGFYIYRNRRLLVPGDWLGIKGWRQEEHYKLARIAVDLPNTTDDEWGIDVTKSRARPPANLIPELCRIGELTRSVAKRIYSHRGQKLVSSHGQERVFLWESVAKHNQVSYRLNRTHPLVTAVESTCTDQPKFRAMLRLIEETIPVSLITITDREKPDQTVGEFENSKASEILEVMRQLLASLCAGGLSRKDALLRLAHFPPFDNFPELLQIIQEEGRNERRL